MLLAQLSSNIDRVKVYASGATVTRVANLKLVDGEVPEKVEIAGLPLALQDASVKARVEASLDTVALPTDICIGLAVPPRTETSLPTLEAEIRQAKAEVRKLKHLIALIFAEIEALDRLYVPKRPHPDKEKAPPPSPLGARLAINGFAREEIRTRAKERREIEEKLRLAVENLEHLLEKKRLASTAKEAKPHELRKTIIVSLSYEGEPQSFTQQTLVIEYFVPGAKWMPTYVCRLDSKNNTAAIAIRALISQRSGEDWLGVGLELSTALPQTWCELPELSSLRIGRAQPKIPLKRGWRQPPIGVETLFENYDAQKQIAHAALPKRAYIPALSPVYLRSLSLLEWDELDIDAAPADFRMIMGVPSAAAEPEEEATEFDVFLKIVPPANKIATLKEIRSISGLGLKEAKQLIESTPVLIKKDVTYEEAESIINKLAKAGAVAECSAGAIEEERVRGMTISSPVTRQLSASPQRRRSKPKTQLDRLAYNLMRLSTADDRLRRGKLYLESIEEIYLQILKRQKAIVSFNVINEVGEAAKKAENIKPFPSEDIGVREKAGSFDYAYPADGRIDVPSDGQFHSVAIASQSTEVNLRYVVVPREDTNVFRIAQLRNPLQAPLLSGMADIYVDGEYILSTKIKTVPAAGEMELGLGVEQSIKVARNTSYTEKRSSESLVALNQLQHKIKIEIANRLSRAAKIEVRETIPIPDRDAQVDVEIDRVSPEWEKYDQKELGAIVKGGYRWHLNVPAGRETILEADYTIKTFVDKELIGGNRRE